MIEFIKECLIVAGTVLCVTGILLGGYILKTAVDLAMIQKVREIAQGLYDEDESGE